MADQDYGYTHYLSKTQALLWGTTSIAFTLTALWLMIQAHTQVPHISSVHMDTFNRMLLNQAEWRTENRLDLTDIKTALQVLQSNLQRATTPNSRCGDS